MQKHNRSRFVQLAFLVSVLIITSISGQAAQPASAESLEQRSAPGDAHALYSLLQQSDMNLKVLPFLRVDLITLYESGRLENAAANNADAPYMAIIDPGLDIPIENIADIANYRDLIYANLYDPSLPLVKSWQLRPDEAIILIAKTPPECAYFSYTGFTFYQYNEKTREQAWIWASINDPLNISTINVPREFGPHRNSTPFDKTIVLIITADRNTESLIRNAALRAGFRRDAINTYVIPSATVKMGIGDEFDTITFGHRMAMFKDDQLGQQYMEQIRGAVKVTPINPVAHSPLDSPNLRVRGTGKTEMDLGPALRELRAAILARNSHLTAEEFNTRQFLAESPDALQTHTYVAGESRDATYLRSDPFKLGDHPEEFVVAYGVNHAATGKATYANANIYGEQAWNGVAGLRSADYAGSADAYLPGHPYAEYLYVVEFARPSRVHATQAGVPLITVPTGPEARGIALEDEAFLGFRAYLEPFTNIGPAYTEILYDQVIRFSPAEVE